MLDTGALVFYCVLSMICMHPHRCKFPLALEVYAYLECMCCVLQKG